LTHFGAVNRLGLDFVDRTFAALFFLCLGRHRARYRSYQADEYESVLNFCIHDFAPHLLRNAGNRISVKKGPDQIASGPKWSRESTRK
jgi:hypothetical protein